MYEAVGEDRQVSREVSMKLRSLGQGSSDSPVERRKGSSAAITWYNE